MAERSLLAAVSGIDANQTYLDSVANDIANADTVGFKSENVQFQDLLAEQLSSGAAPNGTSSAGINPVSIGSGVRVGANTLDLSEGSLEATGQATDVAIQGAGYLITNSNGQIGYTRDGSLTIDGNGNLATQYGGLIQGWQANGSGTINTNAPTSAIRIPSGETIPAQATTSLNLGGNLPAWNGVGTPPVATTTLNAYDSLGNAVAVTMTFTGVTGQANQWSMGGSVLAPNGTVDQLWTTDPTVTFNPANGQVSGIAIGATAVTANTDGSISVPVSTMPGGYTFPGGDTWKFNFPAPNSSSAVTQFAGQQTMALQTQDGHASGSLESFSIGGDGVITGSFSDGTTLSLGEIALASFTNPSGLANAGNGTFQVTSNSGQASVGTAGTGGRGGLLGGELEQSNVNLGTELTNLINAQESYDANTKVLTTSQQVIQALESAGVSDVHGGHAATAVLDDDPTRIRLFDFSRQETIERGRLRVLRPMLEAVAGRVTSTLSSEVRQLVHVDVPDELIQTSWEEYAPTLPDPTYISTALISPGERRLVLHVPVALAFLFVDFSLGGDGLVQPERDDLTDIERALLRPLVTNLWRESIVPALSSFLELSVTSVQTSNSPIFVQVGRPGEICLIVELEVTLADSEAYTVALALPVSAINPVIESVERSQSSDAAGDTNEATVAQVERGLSLVPVELMVSYPSVHFTPSELADLRPGDVLPLTPRTEVGPEVLEVLVGGAVYAHGVLIEEGRNLAISVTTVEERNS